MHSNTEVTLWEGIVWSLCRATADLVWYLGLQALVAEILNKLELVYGTMASFDILMQNFYNLQQGKIEKVILYITWLEVALNVVQKEYLMMLSASEVQQHLGSSFSWTSQAGVQFHALLIWWYKDNISSTHDRIWKGWIRARGLTRGGCLSKINSGRGERWYHEVEWADHTAASVSTETIEDHSQ